MCVWRLDRHQRHDRRVFVTAYKALCVVTGGGGGDVVVVEKEKGTVQKPEAW